MCSDNHDTIVMGRFSLSHIPNTDTCILTSHKKQFRYALSEVKTYVATFESWPFIYAIYNNSSIFVCRLKYSKRNELKEGKELKEIQEAHSSMGNDI